VTDNRAARWTDPTLDPTKRNRDLFAVLDRADLSEPARAAVAHALGPGTGPAGHAEALVNRYLNERERRRPAAQVNGGGDGPGGIGNLPDWLRYDRRGRYTLHLTFAAADFDEAREQAVAYAEGLAILCPELGEHAPLLSRAEAWTSTSRCSVAYAARTVRCVRRSATTRGSTGRPGWAGCAGATATATPVAPATLTAHCRDRHPGHAAVPEGRAVPALLPASVARQRRRLDSRRPVVRLPRPLGRDHRHHRRTRTARLVHRTARDRAAVRVASPGRTRPATYATRINWRQPWIEQTPNTPMRSVILLRARLLVVSAA